MYCKPSSIAPHGTIKVIDDHKRYKNILISIIYSHKEPLHPQNTARNSRVPQRAEEKPQMFRRGKHKESQKQEILQSICVTYIQNNQKAPQ